MEIEAILECPFLLAPIVLRELNLSFVKGFSIRFIELRGGYNQFIIVPICINDSS